MYLYWDGWIEMENCGGKSGPTVSDSTSTMDMSLDSECSIKILNKDLAVQCTHAFSFVFKIIPDVEDSSIIKQF